MYLSAAHIEVLENIARFATTGALGDLITPYLNTNTEE
jgi:hypothetical protein